MSFARRLLIAFLPMAIAASEADHQPHAKTALVGGLQAELARLAPAARARADKQLQRAGMHADDNEALHVDAAGDLFSICAAQPAAAPAIDVAQPVAAAAKVPLSQAPRLHSRPGCARVIHLDFTGHTVTGTAWNDSASVARWDAVAFDRDGDPTTFSTSELTAIQRIWERVAEDFAPFDVDVSTEEVAAGALAMRVLITRDSDAAGRDCPGKGAGGIAYIGVWGSAQAARYAPAWVYANRLGNGREDFVAEACSHEAGHNLGLHHDGTASAAYYGGSGSGEVSWAPIMGVAYGVNVTQWCHGDYPGANQGEDDVAILAQQLGWRGDDHGDSADLASGLALDADGAFTASGVLGRRGDVDAWSLVVGGGTFSLDATPFRAPGYTRGGNADLRLTVRDAAGALVTSAAPPDATAASLDLTLVAGRYTVTVAGDGAAGVYDDYASLGAFTLTGLAVVPVADLSPPAAAADLVLVADGADAFALSWTAPGDDGLGGTAALYALRLAAAPILSEAEWAAAEVKACPLLPAAAGSAQTVRVDWQYANARRWVALRAIDEVGNLGPIATADATTAPPALTVDDAVVTTSAEGGLMATFTIICSPPSATATSVVWSTRDHTALAPTDYTAATGTLIFAPGETSHPVVIAATGGRTAPACLHLELAAAVNADLAATEARAALPAGSGTPGSRSVISVAAPTATPGGGGGSGGCGAGSAIALLALVGAGWGGRRSWGWPRA